ncbi:hypothetical protein GWK47_021264 [Chionoecetes opilio]|uniref:Uncharacterized protein n=1 Tax=Chionoecetes opilio TaxID=41210 RepID=A0A8J4XNN5_CHIOP|nr:hypothetical protein GWK47_021264 [Chionoecetes opilio]
MASQRPRLSTPHWRRQPARHHTSPTQRALQDMLAGMASLVHGTRAPTVTRTPAPVTPEKCEMEMTAAEFHTWRRSVESWVALTGWPDRSDAAYSSELHLAAPACHRCKIFSRSVGTTLAQRSIRRHCQDSATVC